jgi:hypothetical protein
MRKKTFRTLSVALSALAIVGSLAACSSGSDHTGPSTGPSKAAPATSSSPTPAPVVTGSAASPGPVTTAQGPAATCAETLQWDAGSQADTTHSSDAPLYNVRSGRHQCYDRLVFDFNGPWPVGYSTEYVVKSQVVSNAQGAPLSVNGTAFLRLSFRAPILGLDGQGHQPWRGGPVTTGYRFLGAIQLADLKTVGDVVYGGSFEGQTLVYIGVKSGRLSFHVSTWKDPQTQIEHVIVDIAYPQ